MIVALLLAGSITLLVPAVRRLRSGRGVAEGTARGAGSAAAVRYFDSVAGELRRGAVLRQALAIAAPGSRLARLAVTGQPIDLVAAEVKRMFDLGDELAVAGIQLASRSGAPAAVVFSRLAERLRSDEQLARDRRALTAQARLSAAVIALLPVVPGMIMLASGRGDIILEPGPSRSVVLLGLALQVLGLVVIGGLLRADR